MLFISIFAYAEPQQYGRALAEQQAVRIGELLQNPDRYVDQAIQVVGLVKDVCPAKGCWVDILEQQSEQVIRFKVQDDVVVFPVSAKGQDIVAQGILRQHQLSKRAAVKHMRHLAAEKGEAFDPSSVTGPMVFYQIEAQGAQLGGD